jgi:hypothetical protein
VTVLFSEHDRERVRGFIVARAEADHRIVAAAAVGSSAQGGDRWSDVDLSFGVTDGESVDAVLADWTHAMVEEFSATVLFDLPHRASIYRVFLLPGVLQVDLSFTPACEFGALGPRFQLLFGTASEHQPPSSSPPDDEVIGLAIHHAVRARFCIERGRPWGAEYWIHALRDEMLGLECRRRGLPGTHGRGFDALPPEVLTPWREALVREIEGDALLRALDAAVRCLLRDAGERAERPPWLRRALEGLATTVAADG